MSEKYYYAVARTAELENHLLTSDRIERLADAPDAAAAWKLLSGTVYAEDAERIGDPAGFEQMLARQTEQTFTYIGQVAPDRRLADMYLVCDDVANLKILFKGELLGRDFDSLLSPLGIHGAERLKQAFADRDFSDYPAQLGRTVESVRAKLEAGESVGIMEYELDRAQFAIRLELAKKLNSPLLTEYIRVLADMADLCDFLRIREGGKTAFYPVYIGGGFFPLDFFDPYFGDGIGGLAEGLSRTRYAALCGGAEEYLKTGSLTALEKQCADYATQVLRQSRQVAFGPEPLAGYIAARTGEAAQLRVIFVGKLNNIPSAVIKQRLRELY